MKINFEVDLTTMFNAAELREIALKLLPGILPETIPVSQNANTKFRDDEVLDHEALPIEKGDLADTSKVASIATAKAPDGIKWEFAPKPGRRRNLAEIALHKKEIELNRILTPEEKGETKAFTELDEEAEEKAKVDTKEKVRIDGIVDEANAAASEELAAEAVAESTVDLPAETLEAADVQGEAAVITDAEAENTDEDPNTPLSAFEQHASDVADSGAPFETGSVEETIDKEEEATTPKAEELNINSLFE